MSGASKGEGGRVPCTGMKGEGRRDQGLQAHGAAADGTHGLEDEEGVKGGGR